MVVDAKSALEDLLPWIKIAKKGRLFIAKRIDPNLKQLRQYCTDMITWLDKQLATLNERDYMTPTLDEVACFEDLLEIDAIEWLNWNIFIPELSLSGRKRSLIIALATVDIGEEKKARLQEALSQIEAQIEHQQKKANARKELERMMEMANTPTDKQESFFANEPAEPKDLATAFQDLKLSSYVRKRSFVEAALTYWGKTGSGWTYNNIKSK